MQKAEASKTMKTNLNILIKILGEPKPKTNLLKKKIKEIKKDFNELRYGFPKSKIKEIRRNLYDTKNSKNLSESKTK